MMWDVLEKGLRWLFWGLVYLMVLFTAMLLVVGVMPVPAPLKLAMFGVFVWGIGLDVVHKRQAVGA